MGSKKIKKEKNLLHPLGMRPNPQIGLKTRRGHRTLHRNPDSQQDHADVRTSDPLEFQNQETRKSQALRAPAEPSSPAESHGDHNAVSCGINGNEEAKVPSERRKSVYTGGLSKSGKKNKKNCKHPSKLLEATQVPL